MPVLIDLDNLQSMTDDDTDIEDEEEEEADPPKKRRIDPEPVRYRNLSKFKDRYVWANSVDPGKTTPREAVWSGSSLFAFLVISLCGKMSLLL